MEIKNKKLFYGILTGAVIISCLAFNIFLHYRDKRVGEQEQYIENVSDPDSDQEDIEAENENEKSEKTEENNEETNEREVQKNEKYEDTKQEIESYISSNTPELAGNTKEIEKQFLRNDGDTFWHELGIYLFEYFGDHAVKEIEFLEMVAEENKVNCAMGIKDTSEEQIFVMGTYNIAEQYYEFTMIPDTFTYDATEDVGEGGL